MPDLRIKANKHFKLQLVYKDADGFVVDITGASARLMAGRGILSDVLLDVSATIDGPNGVMVFDFLPEMTQDIIPVNQTEETLLFDVDLTLVDGTVLPILDGRIILKKSIVRE